MKAKDNPFRSERVDALAYRADGFSWEELEGRLQRKGGLGAIVGPEGHGKTTLLTQWADRRRDAGSRVNFVRIREGQRWLKDFQRAQISLGGWVFIDSAEQLSLPGWYEVRWLAVRAEALIITAHRGGRLPVLFRCQTNPALLSELVRELTGESRDCTELWKRHRGNVRMALRELYDLQTADGNAAKKV
jgi:hypothetical protein